MYFIYNILFSLIMLIYIPFLFFKSFKGGQIRDFKERLGMIDDNLLERFKDKKTIWVHAASVGETQVGKQIVEKLRDEHPDYLIMFSTMTTTGYKLAKETIYSIDGLIYLPVDIPFIVNKVLNKIRPELLILVETELWPNLIKKARQNGSRIMLVSGRIGDKSFRHYKAIKPLIERVLSNINSFYMQSKLDAERIIDLGAFEEKVQIAGNIKYDRKFDQDIDKESILQRLGINKGDPILVAGSTHDDEEEQLLNVYKKVKSIFPELFMIIAPRYIDRVEEIEQIYLKKGMNVRKWTDLKDICDEDRTINSNKDKKLSGDTSKTDVDIIIVDTFGELAILYQIATLVFIGGSLITRGGHNILEPAAYGKTVFVGPHMFNFKEDVNYFNDNNALIQVVNADELAEKIIYYLNNSHLLKEKGDRSRQLLERNQGALYKNIEGINYLLRCKPKILLVRLSAIGDVIHALPAAFAVRNKYPTAEINWLVEDRIAGLVGLNSYIDNIIVMPRSRWKSLFKKNKWDALKLIYSFLRSLKNYNIDIVVDLHGMFKSALPVGMTKAPIRFGRSDAREFSTMFYNRKIKIPSDLTHKIDRNLYLMKKALGLDIDEINYGFNIGISEQQTVDNLLREYSLTGKKYIVINPFTTWKTKNWILNRYIKLANRIIEELEYEVIFTGGPRDREEIDKHLHRMQSTAYNFAARTNLVELVELYKRAELYIGGDTGPMHLAVAVSLPVVAIMGPTDPVEFGPYGSNNIVLRDTGLKCINCWNRKCKNNLQCMKNITVEQVFRAVQKQLEAEAGRDAGGIT